MVPDLQAILALGNSLQLAGEMTKAMIGIRDGAMFQAKAIELQGIILDAQASALTANAGQFTMVDRIRDLEAKVASLEAWEAEKKRYELKDIGNLQLAYSIKPEMQGTEPAHHICANCYNQSKKRILQLETMHVGRAQAYVCHDCGSTLYIAGHSWPEPERKSRR